MQTSHTHGTEAPPQTTGFDISRKFVRILRTHANGLVEFSFAVGDPDVCAELLMPQAAFEAFCASHAVQWLAPLAAPLPQDDASATQQAGFQWGLHQATSHRL